MRSRLQNLCYMPFLPLHDVTSSLIFLFKSGNTVLCTEQKGTQDMFREFGVIIGPFVKKKISRLSYDRGSHEWNLW